MVSSKFSFRFYFGYIFVAGVLTVGFFGLTHLSQLTVIKYGVSHTPRVICCLFVGVGLLSLTFQLISACTLKVWSDRIVIRHLFSRTTVLKQDVITVDLFGRIKRPGSGHFSSFILIDRKQGKRIRLPDQDFRNAPAIKRALRLYYPTSSPDQAIGYPLADPAYNDRQAEKFAGRWFLSGYGIGLCLISLFAAMIFFGTHSNLTAAVKAGLMLAFILVFYFPFGTQFYHFELSGGSLVIKNHFYPWYTRTIRLVDIRSATVENPGAGRVILNITTTDFKSSRFPADSLREQQWKALVQKLKGKGIPVTNEAYG